MKRRADSFFGLHFDFHATPASGAKPIGETLREEDIREICRLVRPDFLQIDCKGHPGWASYPTRCGNAMPDIACDTLAMWRKVTKEEGVALYLHYSGVVDVKYCMENPRESVMRADGTRRAWATRTNGKYVDELLIPQLNELAEYGADGVWVDGDCWGAEADFDPETVKQFEAETGIKLNGKKPCNRGDEYFDEYRDFCRELYRRYVRHYVDKVHEKHPDFQVASNWAFTDHMPEKISANVDFISGDLNPQYSFESARYAGRAIAQHGFTWDLMSWNFRSAKNILPGHTVKHPVQIMQEAAAVISLGGGFQNYITQYGDGSPRMEEIRRMKEVSDFMRAREKFCFRGKSVHQVALLLSTHDRLLESDSLFSRNGNEKIMGMTSLLCDAGHSVEIISEHMLMKNPAAYPVIVIPELYKELEEETARALLTYAKAGGNLVLVGRNTLSFFAEMGLDVRMEETSETARIFTSDGETFGLMGNTSVLHVDGAETVAWVSRNDYRIERSPLAVVKSSGRGKIVLVGADLGSAYQTFAQYTHVDMVNAILGRLYEPLVRVEQAEGTLEVTALEKDGCLMIQLVNANGNHRNPNVATERCIPSVRDIVISVKAGKSPEKMILQPEGRALAIDYHDGRAYVTIDRVNIHEIVEVRA